ncbi:MAG: RnfABCDGE type electron transport complex subunit D [Eubacteriales bacterium]|nr:RnfABCDGE type electron transport complex subunit D [Eubacteriales bacterium]
MGELFHVSSNPHIRASHTTGRIMMTVLIALMPAAIFGIFNFGAAALITILLSMASCVATEYIYEKLMHKKITISDCSAAVTGLLLALNLPATVPWWIPVLGGIFAILIVKQLFGGLGQNFMNPALTARCFLLISFTGRMTTFTYDGITGATPLGLLKSGESVDVLSMFFGTTGGAIGETSTLAILIGAAFLLWKKVISLRIPGMHLGVFAIFVILFGGHGFDLSYLAAQLCGGGLMLAAFFMATDYVTSPITKKGQLIYGGILGILTGLFRIFGNSAEGVSYAIIFSNLLVPLIDRVTIPKAFGKGGEKH